MAADGVITLEAENTVEAFALSRWAELAIETIYVDDAPGALSKTPRQVIRSRMLIVRASLD